jgi:hypothetical protein
MPEVFPTRFTLPLTREVRFTTRLNRTPDFTELRAQDQAAPLFRWDLQLGPLSDAEFAAIQGFYAARGGGYESFVFLDPLDNLLQWSEDFSQAAWLKSNPSGISITSGIADPLGGSTAQAIANTGGSVNTLSQSIAANPQGITLTASVWLLGTVTLRLTDGAGQTFSSTVTAGSWTRHSVSGMFASAGSQIVFAIDLPASASVSLFGAQLVATAGAGSYTRTTTVSGFHPNCAFDSQPLAHRVVAPGVNHVKLSILEHA